MKIAKHSPEANAIGHFLRVLFERNGRLPGRLPVREGCNASCLGLEGGLEEGSFFSVRFTINISTDCFGSFLKVLDCGCR